MFTILGTDGKEYGPVSTGQIKEWILAGRANAQTRARAADGAEWKTLADFSEFAAALSQPKITAPPATSQPELIARDLIARAPVLDIGACISRSWNLLRSDFWPIVAATFVLLVVAIAVGVIPFANLLLGGVFIGGLEYYFLRRIRGETPEVGDVFAGFSLAFSSLLLATLVSSLLTIVGIFLLIIPGIYLWVAWTFAYLLVIDRKLEFWDAMEVSRRVITHQWWRMLLLVIVAGILGWIGVIALGIGIFITLPIFFGALVYAYTDLCPPPAAAASSAPAPSPPAV